MGRAMVELNGEIENLFIAEEHRIVCTGCLLFRISQVLQARSSPAEIIEFESSTPKMAELADDSWARIEVRDFDIRLSQILMIPSVEEETTKFLLLQSLLMFVKLFPSSCTLEKD
mmetsp:Transcript_35836/g.55742  ORF Transcript_35836/g.55742 Transcript_35836/m.55742 type:complete len:115 (-) Transcript_35836:152-496(-)